MPAYSVFGTCLDSEIVFPELRPTPAPREEGGERPWTLRVAPAAEPAPDDSDALLGTDTVMPGVAVRLYRPRSGYRLVYDDTGRFDIAPARREIRWMPGPRSWVEAARIDMINRVLPIALYAAGRLCLHGSAVSLGGTAVAFLAPCGYGKSTLAVALMELGGRLLTDDTLPVVPRPPVMAGPGVHSVRLLDDAAQAVVGDAGRLRSFGAYPMPRRDLPLLAPGRPAITKQILRALPESRLQLDAVPLAAVYVLKPVRANGDAAASRTLLPGVRGAVSLIEHAKSGALLGRSAAPTLFDRAVRVARDVPVYRLAIVRDLARIAEAAEHVATWHAPAGAPAV